MPLESRSAEATRTSSPATANKHRSAGISRPAVQPVQAMLANMNGDDVSFQLNDEQTAETRAFSLPAENKNDRREALDVKPFQLKPAGFPASPVVQREPLTKEKIFNDQVKWLVVQGVARMNAPKSGSAGGEQFAMLLASKNLINRKALLTAYIANKFNQSLTLEEEKDKLLSGVTLANLQQHNLVMEAVTFADVAEGKWEIYRPDLKKGKTAEGLGGETDQSQQVKTSIAWKSTIHDQGQGVTAKVLGPDHPLGSTPNESIKENVDSLKEAAGGKKYVAGHLLNHNLGGPGNNAKNLTAIPADVNSEMSTRVEDEVIERVNKDHQVVFYKVDVEYNTDGQEDYASKISIEFGSYKPGTIFSQADPDTDLDAKHTFVLPISSPTVYGAAAGYKKTENSGEHIYEDQSNNKYTWKKPDNANLPARLKFDRMNNIILKDDKQIKLEFIAAAIYSSSIRELKVEVEQLSKEKDVVKGELGTLQSKYEQLQAEAKKNTVLEEQLKTLAAQFQQETEERLEAEGENEVLKKEIKDMEIRIDTVGNDLKKEKLLVEELRDKLNEYMEKARARAGSEGFVEGFNDGKKGIAQRVETQVKMKRVSLMSEPNFSGGYQEGHQVGRELAKQEEENLRLHIENEQQRTLILDLETENQELHVTLDREREERQREREISRKKEEEMMKKLEELQKEKENFLLMKEEIKPVTEQLQNEQVLLESEQKVPGRQISEKDDDKIHKEEKKVPEPKVSTSGQLDTSGEVDKDERIKKLFEEEYDKNGNDGWENLSTNKYKYLSILVYLGKIEANEAFEAYRKNSSYYSYFYNTQVRQKTYQEFKDQYK